MYFVYIIQSELDQSYYKGFTEDLLLRLKRHNNGESAYTRHKMPWHFVYIESFSSKTEALRREKALKKYSHAQIEHLIACSKNQIAAYLNG